MLVAPLSVYVILRCNILQNTRHRICALPALGSMALQLTLELRCRPQMPLHMRACGRHNFGRLFGERVLTNLRLQ